MPVPTSTLSTVPSSRIVFPDLFTPCPFPLRVNPLAKQIGSESEAWLVRRGNLSAKKQKALNGLKCGLITGMCYADAPEFEFRVVCDFIVYLFHLDNISDNMDDAGTVNTQEVVMRCLREFETYKTSTRVGKMTKDFWQRVRQTGSSGMQRRFIETFDLFFQAVTQQAKDRHSGAVQDLESYIALRRNTSGCKPCWALIEYAYGLDIPDVVMSHQALEDMGEAANDIVTWSNDIFSYNVEQSRGDTHNMVVIIMRTEGLPMQDAIDHVGELCKQCFDRFVSAKASLPSFDHGGKVDRDVAQYVKGLEDWMVGNLHWTFATERYFGKSGPEVKCAMSVDLLPVSSRS